MLMLMLMLMLPSRITSRLLPLPQLIPIPARMHARPTNSNIEIIIHKQRTRRQISSTDDLLENKVHALEEYQHQPQETIVSKDLFLFTYVIIVSSLKLGGIVPPHAWFVLIVVVVDLLT